MTVYRVTAVTPDRDGVLQLDRSTLTEAFLLRRSLVVNGWHLVGGPRAVTTAANLEEAKR